jgi:hypothetical protein
MIKYVAKLFGLSLEPGMFKGIAAEVDPGDGLDKGRKMFTPPASAAPQFQDIHVAAQRNQILKHPPFLLISKIGGKPGGDTKNGRQFRIFPDLTIIEIPDTIRGILNAVSLLVVGS